MRRRCRPWRPNAEAGAAAVTRERLLLPGTPSETVLTMEFSGKPGPVLMVLGGVHGNEPGGWMRLRSVILGAVRRRPHRPSRGRTASPPQTSSGRQTTWRLEPPLPRFASKRVPHGAARAEIVAVAREFNVDVVWTCMNRGVLQRPQPERTAFLGQTVTTGIGPRNPSPAATSSRG